MNKYLLPIISILISVTAIVLSLLLIDNKSLGARTDGGFWNLTNGSVYFSGKVGIATATMPYELNVFSTGTSTLYIDSVSTTSIACIKMRDSDASGFTWIKANNGVLSATTTACE